MSDDLESRVSTVEANVQGLHEDVRDLTKEVRDGFGEIRTGLRERKPQTINVIALIALGVSILGGLITLGAQGPIWRLDAAEKSVTNLEEKYHEHIKDGHPRRIEEKVLINKENIDKLGP